mgnify:CR=1 FL=1
MTREEVQDLQRRFGEGQYNNEIRSEIGRALTQLHALLLVEDEPATVAEEVGDGEEEVPGDEDEVVPSEDEEMVGDEEIFDEAAPAPSKKKKK